MKKHPEQKFTTKRLLNTISYRDDCLSSSDDTSHGWLHFIWHTKQKRTRYNCILYPWVLTVSVPIEISILWDTKKCARALASWERKRTLASMLLMFSCVKHAKIHIVALYLFFAILLKWRRSVFVAVHENAFLVHVCLPAFFSFFNTSSVNVFN